VPSKRYTYVILCCLRNGDVVVKSRHTSNETARKRLATYEGTPAEHGCFVGYIAVPKFGSLPFQPSIGERVKLHGREVHPA
jgi:hypothetical protein